MKILVAMLMLSALSLVAEEAQEAWTLERFLQENPPVRTLVWEHDFGTATNYEASLQPDTCYMRTSFDGTTLVGIAGDKVWQLSNGLVVAGNWDGPSAPISNLSDIEIGVSMWLGFAHTAILFGCVSAEPGTIQFDGDSFTAQPRQEWHKPMVAGRVHGEVTSRDSLGRITSLWISSTVWEGTNQVRYQYDHKVHPSLPSEVRSIIPVDGKDMEAVQRYFTIAVGITNLPTGYVPSMWMEGELANGFILYTNKARYRVHEDGRMTPVDESQPDNWAGIVSLISLFVGATIFLGVRFARKLRQP